jgi:uncharacterized protein (TIGR03000 family)
MYSVLLTAMMSTGATAPEFGGVFANGVFGNGCQGCAGCVGCFGGCGGCYGGCMGCGGCRGGGFLGLGLFSSRHSGCYGCSGCFGCGGCCGGCMGCFGGCMGCYGMPIEWSVGYPMDPITFGIAGNGTPAMPTMPALPTPNLGETLNPAVTGPAPTLGDLGPAPNQATVVVTLPADAKLFIEGQPIDQVGSVRTIRTPAQLEIGKPYYYVIAMEVTRNGRPIRKEETVTLEAGKVTRVEFPEPTPPTGNTASIQIRLPADAVLTVDGQTVAANDGQVVIRTPSIDGARKHYYQLKVEMVRQNVRHILTRDVAFQAGHDLRVEFEEPAAAPVARR